MDEQMREKFEVFYSQYFRGKHYSTKALADAVKAHAWEIWQAAFAAALSQPAAQVDSSHSGSGECGGVQVRAVLLDVEAERQRQDIKWGGPAHDDSHEIADFVQLIEDYAGWARTMAGMGSYDKARNRLIQVAALASACCESIDRSTPKATP